MNDKFVSNRLLTKKIQH